MHFRRILVRTACWIALATFAVGVQGANAQTTGAQQPADPVAELITVSRLHFEAGERELGLGHLQSARAEFNRALEVLLESPFGGRIDPRMREHFDRLVERISAYEVTALAQGDGFEEQRSESASIDQLLSVSTF